jgi:hypothetical protein
MIHLLRHWDALYRPQVYEAGQKKLQELIVQNTGLTPFTPKSS